MRVGSTTRGDGGGASQSESGSRAAERAEQMRLRRKWFVTALSLVIFSAVIGLVLGIFGSELFRVRNVLVESEDQSLAREATEQAQKLDFGTIWLPPMRQIERRIGGLPRAKQVRVNRRLPSTLLVVVEPRTVVAAVEQAERLMMVDEEGVCLHWTGSVPEGLPRVRVENAASLRVGANIGENNVQMMNALRAGLRENDLLERARIDLTRPVRIEVITADGVIGKLGNQDLLHEKTLLFGELLHSLEARGESLLYIDLRVPSQPTFKRAS